MLFQKPTYDWLIAGLGNPGPEYEKTRHNTGFMSLDLLAARLQVKVSKERFKALTAQADFDGQRLLLMKPLTFMNASGIAIEAAAHFYKIPPERVLVLFDDISLPVGKLRIRKNGSAGGHNGLKSIIARLGGENFPRIQSTRQLQRDGSQYFGPYSSVTMQHSILEFIREVIPLRTCSLNLAPEAIARGRYTVCLQYHLGNCKGPCIGAQSAEEYRQLLDMAVSVLKGDLRPVRAYLEGEMRRAAEALQFETAQRYKSRLAALENYSARSVIVSARIVDVDVFSLVEDDDAAYCNFLRIRNGSITAVSTVRLTPGVDTDRAQMLTLAIQHVVEQIAGGELAREVIVPFLPSATMLFDGVTFTVPRRGEKLDLLAFSERSARIYRAEQLKNMEIKNPERHTERLMNAMQKELRLPRQPRHIECFDNSNLQGTNPVASCVVFRDGRPSRKEYRHFNIKTVVGADDFASMREIVFRRYTRLMAEGQELPDLVIVDGGKGQLSNAYAVLCELGLEKQVPIVGLAKRLEEIYYPGDPMPYYLSRTGEPLKVVCHIRDEAHRFGITFHRQKRSNDFLRSELKGIAGIGPRTVETLLGHFRTVARIRNASDEELIELIGAARTQRLRKHFASS